ncbi:cbb3-type cytochrome oxidase assembly protein CcoS [Vreelandella massiliensis]|uniref:cbb3-type cytochrome oxidase assembly protein CcoS n=1 Tax=Vreelandella massiliensis TaxID=1816686 RepID=UPI00096ABA76|nr:cbb3-type cytochrome oxidase assembly protein CcoS [Halomonas massiliensis]MYL23042.1 cbb3-type cytochrome oxidase assembly protein CcoS [Halomonas alkaliantarctica]
MKILYLLIPLSLVLLGLAVWAFFWAVKNDQFDDLEGPAHRILFDEDENDLPPEERQRRQQARERKTTTAADDDASHNDSDTR